MTAPGWRTVLAEFAQASEKLPAELRMGAEAAGRLRGGAQARPVTVGALDGSLWTSSIPVKVDAGLPPNAWILVDGRGRATIAGVMAAAGEETTAAHLEGFPGLIAELEQLRAQLYPVRLHGDTIELMRHNLANLRWWQWRRRRNIEHHLAGIALAVSRKPAGGAQ